VGKYWTIANVRRCEQVDPNSLDCGIKRLDDQSYWDHRNEAARALEWLLVTRRWNAADVFLVSDLDDVVGLSMRHVQGPGPTYAQVLSYTDVALIVRAEMLHEPLPIPDRAVFEWSWDGVVETVYDDRGGVLRRREQTDEAVAVHGVGDGFDRVSEYSRMVDAIWAYDGVWLWLGRTALDSPELIRPRVTLVVSTRGWRIEIADADARLLAAQEGPAADVESVELGRLRHELPEALHPCVDALEVAIRGSRTDLFPALRRARSYCEPAGDA
jgi:hypothetical protein